MFILVIAYNADFVIACRWLVQHSFEQAYHLLVLSSLP
jgi:hypothetical protein